MTSAPRSPSNPRRELRRWPAEVKDTEMPERRRVGFVLVSHDSCSPTFLPAADCEGIIPRLGCSV